MLSNCLRSAEGFWQTDIAGVSINGVPIQLSERSAVIDTGTTIIIGDQKDVEEIYSQIPGSKPAPDTLGEGLFTSSSCCCSASSGY